VDAVWDRHPKLSNWRDNLIRRSWSYSVFMWVEDGKISGATAMGSLHDTEHDTETHRGGYHRDQQAIGKVVRR